MFLYPLAALPTDGTVEEKVTKLETAISEESLEDSLENEET